VAEATSSMTYKALQDAVVRTFKCDTPTAKVYVLGGVLRMLRAHRWSFLETTAELTVAAEAAYTALPDDLREVSDPPTFAADSNYRFDRQVTVREILAERSANDTTGTPRLWAVGSSGYTPAAGQRYRLYLYPRPVEELTLWLPYRIHVAAMSNDGDYPPGGAAHAPSVLAAAYAEAEIASRKTKGLYYRQWREEALPESIRLDAGLSGGKAIAPGYRANRPDWRREQVTINVVSEE